jgi:3-hydroxyisobutyrate dehydrogenase-like beta-hydroxyacid dehydrogenase
VDKPRIGFIGLGSMGKPMALRLVEAGYDVLVADRRPEATRPLEEAGAVALPTPLLVADEADVLMSCLPSDSELFELYLGPEGALEHLRRGAVVIDFSTATPMMMQRIAADAALREIRVVDAPVCGGPVEARHGQLTLIVGTERSVFEQVIELLQVLGHDLHLVGGPGMGKVVKLVTNAITGSALVLIGEALTLAANAGADLQKVFEVVRSSSGGWQLWNDVVPELLRPAATVASFRLELMTKDLELAVRLGADLGSPLPLTALAYQFYVAAGAHRMGPAPAHEVARVIARLGNTQLERSSSLADLRTGDGPDDGE